MHCISAPNSYTELLDDSYALYGVKLGGSAAAAAAAAARAVTPQAGPPRGPQGFATPPTAIGPPYDATR